MKFKQIDILGKKYKIKKMPKKYMSGGEFDYLGICDDRKALIYLNPKLQEGEDYFTTLLHEIGHAIMYRNGVRFNGMIPIELEEIIVETGANVFYGLLKQVLKDIEKSGSITEVRDKIQAVCRDIK